MKPLAPPELAAIRDRHEREESSYTDRAALLSHIDALEGALDAVMCLATGDDALYGRVIDALHRGANGE